MSEAKNGTNIIYGWSWKCVECGEVINMIWCDNFAPINCFECGGELINTPMEEAINISKELRDKFGTVKTDEEIKEVILKKE